MLLYCLTSTSSRSKIYLEKSTKSGNCSPLCEDTRTSYLRRSSPIARGSFSTLPDLVPSAVRKSDLRQPGFDTSALLASTAPPIELPSRGRIEGNVTGGGERRIFQIPDRLEGLEATLFKNRADLKLLTSQVAMHLSTIERSSLFSAID